MKGSGSSYVGTLVAKLVAKLRPLSCDQVRTVDQRLLDSGHDERFEMVKRA